MEIVKEGPVGTILRLLSEQQENLKQWPFNPDQIERDRAISAQLRELCDELSCSNSLDDKWTVTVPCSRPCKTSSKTFPFW